MLSETINGTAAWAICHSLYSTDSVAWQGKGVGGDTCLEAQSILGSTSTH